LKSKCLAIAPPFSARRYAPIARGTTLALPAPSKGGGQKSADGAEKCRRGRKVQQCAARRRALHMLYHTLKKPVIPGRPCRVRSTAQGRGREPRSPQRQTVLERAAVTLRCLQGTSTWVPFPSPCFAYGFAGSAGDDNFLAPSMRKYGAGMKSDYARGGKCGVEVKSDTERSDHA
jgi:hypothetical protein